MPGRFGSNDSVSSLLCAMIELKHCTVGDYTIKIDHMLIQFVFFVSMTMHECLYDVRQAFSTHV